MALAIIDTAGVEQYTTLHEHYMREADGFLLVFSCDFASSLGELSGLRQQIIQSKCGASRFPMVLVGNKSDLELDRDELNERAKRMTEEGWARTRYYRTSAKAGWWVDDAFEDVCRQILWENLARPPPHVPERKRCIIL